MVSIDHKHTTQENKFKNIIEALEPEFDLEKFKIESKNHGYNEKEL